MRKRLPISLGLALLSAWCAPEARADATVELTVSGSAAYVNEPFEAIIKVERFQTCDPPTPPEIANATVRMLGTGSDSVSILEVNRKLTQSRTRTYHLEITPRSAGELVIPPIALKVDGKVLQTTEARLKVRPSDVDDIFSIEISAGRSRIYVGQRVQIKMTLLVKPPRIGSRVRDPDDVLRNYLRADDLGPFPRQVSIGQRNVADGSGRNTLYYTYEFTTDYVAERPGALKLDDVQISMQYPQGNSYRTLRPKPSVHDIEVVPLPMEGRPDSFAGAVGIYDIAVQASPTALRVGDPIELRIDLFGDGQVETLPPPLLTANKALAAGFRLPSETLSGETVAAKRRYTLIVRPKSADVTEVPAIEYPYFDPDAERYVVARSQPIPLKVAPVERVDPTTVTTGAPGSEPGTTVEPLDGLHDIETDERALLAVTDGVSVSQALLATLAPPLVFVGAWGWTAFVRSRNADPARRRRATALRQARGRIAQAGALPPREGAAALAGALAAYLADRANEPEARFIGRAGVDLLRARGVADALAARWAEMVERCERVAFAGPGEGEIPELMKLAESCVVELERTKL